MGQGGVVLLFIPLEKKTFPFYSLIASRSWTGRNLIQSWLLEGVGRGEQEGKNETD